MTKIPDNLKYSQEHEWVKIEDDIAVIGITDYAQESLGDIVFAELPEIEDQLEAESVFGVIESVKAASDIYTPLSGVVVEINENVLDSPELINQDPYEKGWLIKLKLSNVSEIDDLLTKEQYQDLIAEEE